MSKEALTDQNQTRQPISLMPLLDARIYFSFWMLG